MPSPQIPARGVGGFCVQGSRLILISAALAAFLSTLLYALRTVGGNPGAREAPEPGPAWRAALLGLMAALAAMMQVSAAFWPGVGHILAALSSLPVAAGVLLVPKGALPMILAAAGLLASIYAHEALVFLLTTAPVGLMAAWAARLHRPVWLRLLLPGVAVSSGILLMVYAAGLPVFGDSITSLAPLFATTVYVAFGFTYTWLWIWLAGRLAPRLLRLQTRVHLERD